MNRDQYFSNILRKSLGSKQRLFSSTKYSTVSAYATQESQQFLKVSNQQNRLEVVSKKQQESSKKTVNFGNSSVKKAVKTIKLKTNLKTQNNENDHDKILFVKSKLRLNRCPQNTDRIYQSFQKSELKQNNQQERVIFINQQKYASQNKINPRNFQTTINHHSRFSSYHNTSRYSQMYSISPIKDKLKLQSKLKKVQTLYQNSVKNYKQILIKLQIELQKVKMLEKHKQSFKIEKLLFQKLILQKQEIIISKQQLISNQFNMLNQKQSTIKQYQTIIIQSQEAIIQKNRQNQLLKYENELKSNHYEQSIKKYENDILFLNKQLESANNRNIQSSTQYIKCLEDIASLKKQKQSLVQNHIQQLYSKNKLILQLNQSIGMRINQNQQINKIKHFTQSNSLQLSHDEDEKSSVIIQTENCLKQQNAILFSEQQIILTDENQFMVIKRDSLMDMNEVMSIQASQCSYRDNYE